MSVEPFHAALRDNPDDDFTRLVYADFLDDHGESDRAAFVRLAVELEKLPQDDPNRRQLLNRYNDRRLTHGAAWLRPRPDSLLDVGYRGGLVNSMKFGDRVTAADVEAQLARHPVTALTIDGIWPPGIRQLALSPCLYLLRSLTVSGVTRERAGPLGRLLHAPGLSLLRDLCVAGEAVDPELAQVISQSPALWKLRVLRLERPRPTRAQYQRHHNRRHERYRDRKHQEQNDRILEILRGLLGLRSEPPHRTGRLTRRAH